MKSTILNKGFELIDVKLFEYFRGKTICITGATGLIGSLICKALLWANKKMNLDVEVIAIVRDVSKASQIFLEYGNSNSLKFICLDLSKTNLVNIDNCDYIVHAAAITNSRTMVEQPVDVIKMSVKSTMTMLDLAKTTRAKLLYISSMEIYGSINQGEIADEMVLGYLNLASPRSCYPESKRLCEVLCNSYVKQYGADVCIARLAQTLGAGILPGENRVFAQFARSAMAGEDIVLKTKGKSEGNYINSIDCVSALLLLLAQGNQGESYNVVNEESHGTILEVANLVKLLLGNSKSKIICQIDTLNSSGYAPDVHLRLSCNKLRKLGWKPMFSLSDSFMQLAAYLNEQNKLMRF